MIDAQKIIVALDCSTPQEVNSLLNEFEGQKVWIKVGMELYYALGPEIIQTIHKKGHPVFLDLKLHDIPNTVYSSLKILLKLPIAMINVHALGGSKMMKEAKKALTEASHRPLLIGVTILTSLNDSEVQKELTQKNNLSGTVLHLSQLVKESGLDGVVASPQETKLIREKFGKDFKIVTPGIRPNGFNTHDQERVLTPEEAISLGSNYLVIGRPITKSDNPRQALLNILGGVV
jgi:orotidine-5'-phosphate decarboxylase